MDKSIAEIAGVPLKDWLALHRREGMAHGLLTGWLHWDGTEEHLERLKSVTRKHLNGE